MIHTASSEIHLDRCIRRQRPACLRIILATTMVATLLIRPAVRAQFPEGNAKAAAAAKLGLGDLIKRANQSVVLINIENKAGQKVGFGSGFLIDDKGLVATNLHVVRQAAMARVVFEFKDGNKADIKCLRAYDKQGDLAILELARVPAASRPLPLGPREFPTQGDAVTALGHPSGLNFSASTGIVSGIRRTSDNNKVKPGDDRVWIQSTAAVAGGSSGGPLLSERGEVIGINARALPGQGIALAVHVSHLLDLLAKARKASPQPLPGTAGSELFNPLVDLEPRVKDTYDDYINAIGQFRTQLQNADNRFQYDLVMRLQNPGPKYAKRFFQIAQAERKSIAAFQALYLACVADVPRAPGSLIKQALQRILEDHAKERWLHHAFQGLSRQDHESVPAFYREVLKRNPDRTVQGIATFYLATLLSQKPKFDEAEVLALFKRCTGEFKDVQLEFQYEEQRLEYDLAELATPRIFEHEHLRVGKKAPEIVGKDVEGKTFKLSDYRGKVVVLDFFADWCPYCVRMYSEERELVEKMAGKPFAILGVNCDGKDTLRQILEDKKVTWRCWSDGKGGPIAETWQLEGYPLMFVIDHEGIICDKFSGQTAPGVLKETVARRVSSVPGYRPKIAEVGRLTGHQRDQTVEFATFAQGGSKVLSGSSDKTIILWDRKTGKMIRRLDPTGGKIMAVAVLPDGHKAVSGGEDKIIRLWDLESGRVVRELKGHKEWIFSVAVSPDGRTAYSTSGGPNPWGDGVDSAVRVWDLEKGTEIRRLEGHRGRVLSVASSPDGSKVLTGGDTRVILWDARTGQILRRFDGHTELVECVAFLPDGKRVVSSSYDKTIRLWDTSSGKELGRFVGHPREVTWFAVSPDGKRLLSADFNAHELRLWDLETRQQLERIDLGKMSPTRGSFSPDGKFVVWPGTEGALLIFDLATSKPAENLASSAKSAEIKRTEDSPAKAAAAPSRR